MTTAVDTNVIIGLWDRDPILSAAAQRALDAAPVFSEARVSGEPPDKPSNPMPAAAAESATPARGAFSPTSLSALMPL